MNLTERFLRYIQIDTQADENSTSAPSSAKQWTLLHLLGEELASLNIAYELSPKGILYAYLPANTKSLCPLTIGLVAHVDTALEASGQNVKPQIIKNYTGQVIKLGQSGLVLSPEQFPLMHRVIGQDLITTDGKTLLGGDDKAGIAIIMDLLAWLQANPSFEHVNLRIAFTSDEEIGRGVDHFDFDKFNVDYAYTIDGGDIEAANFENFNAASAHVSFRGKAIHPGSAKGQMVNASKVALEFDRLLPKDEIPELTEGYQGFHHLTGLTGGVEHAESHYIIRNHNLTIFARQKTDFVVAQDKLNKKHDAGTVTVTITDSYFNMGPLFKEKREALIRIEQAYQSIKHPLIYLPIRGGTDGARMAFKGVLTPNLGTGGYNAHGPYEFVSITQMETMVKILQKIVSA